MDVGLNSGIYKFLLVLHIVAVVVGFGGVVLNGLYGARAKRAGGREGLAISETNFWITEKVAEPAIYAQLRGPHRMIVGLANDEIGYIIPKRQWDEKKPFCYGRKKAQYGESNSVGPEAAPIICRVFKELLQK